MRRIAHVLTVSVASLLAGISQAACSIAHLPSDSGINVQSSATCQASIMGINQDFNMDPDF